MQLRQQQTGETGQTDWQTVKQDKSPRNIDGKTFVVTGTEGLAEGMLPQE